MKINPITVLKSYFKSKKRIRIGKRKEYWKQVSMNVEIFEKDLYEQGFNKIKFPILLIEGSVNVENNEFEFDNYEFTVVWDLSEFAWTNWYHSASMEFECKLMDFNAEIWDFKYNEEIKVCTPGSSIKRLELNEFKSFVIESINRRNVDEVKDKIENANSISSVFEVIEMNHKSFL